MLHTIIQGVQNLIYAQLLQCKPLPVKRKVPAEKALDVGSKFPADLIEMVCLLQAGRVAAVATAPSPSTNSSSSSNLSTPPLVISFDNNDAKDNHVTVITISGPDSRDLLMQLTGAFNSLNLLVAGAEVVTTNDGQIRDKFKVTDQQHQKVSLQLVPKPYCL